VSRGALNDWPRHPRQTSEESVTPTVLAEEPLIGRAHDDGAVLHLLAGPKSAQQGDLDLTHVVLELEGRKA